MESTCTQWLWFERRQIDLGDETQAQYNQCSKEAYRIQKYTNFPTFREANAIKHLLED